MCGIVAYVGNRNSAEIIQRGLHRLEYRGYDSAGIAVLNGQGIRCVKSSGKLAALDAKLQSAPLVGSLGIGHTRWATHGPPTETNAHPHLDQAGAIAIAHNGIIENFEALRAALKAAGVEFRSETDSEVLAHLIRQSYDGDLFEAVKKALRQVRGAYALVVICESSPGEIVAARSGGPLVLGLGENEMFASSDVAAIVEHTRKVVYLGEGQVARLTPADLRVEDLAGNVLEPAIHTVDWDPEAAEKNGFDHFMLKEIHEQPEVVRRLLNTYVDRASGTVQFPDLGFTHDQIRSWRRVAIVACGTAYHAGIAAKYWFERIAGLHTDVEIASEFRYREPVLDNDTTVLAISQSGETTDTLEAVRLAQQHGCRVLSVLNVFGSSMARETDGIAYIHAGPEIGVASTKAYMAQLTTLLLLALHIGRARGSVSAEVLKDRLEEMHRLPGTIESILGNASAVEALARDPKYRDAASALFLGRGYNLSTAIEGALKLKEISYIHAEGTGAGEMKHGWIALVTDTFPTICVAVQGSVYDKMLSNVAEIRARKGIVLAVATEGDEHVRDLADDVLSIPACPEYLSPLPATVVLQLLAYYTARARGCDVDQPRNLAKSVTVE